LTPSCSRPHGQLPTTLRPFALRRSHLSPQLNAIGCIHAEQLDCHSANCRQADNATTLHVKMLLPIVDARLNNGVSALVNGSIAATSGPLCELHRRQASARLSSASVPPCWRARICST
jgi:hypothetical protein